MILLVVLLEKNINVKNHTAAILVTVVMTNGAHQHTAGNKDLGIGTQLMEKLLLMILLIVVTKFLLVVLNLQVVKVVNGVLLRVVLIYLVLLFLIVILLLEQDF